MSHFNLEPAVSLEGMVQPDGTLNLDRAIESVNFQSGGSWSAAQLVERSLQGSSASDVIRGYSSSDTIDGGAGNDALYGGAGDDALSGGLDADSLYGEAGADSLAGNTGNDWLYGGEGDDVLSGNEHDDGLFGGAGNDRLFGGSGADRLDGEAGDDWLDAGPGGGQLLGGTGNDTYVVRAGDGAISVGALQRGLPSNEGFEVLLLEADPTAVTFSVTLNTFGSEEDELRVTWNDASASVRLLLEGGSSGPSGAVEDIRFTDGTSLNFAQLVASATTQPTMGNDTVWLRSTDDIYASGEGDDVVYGRAGDDQIDGGAGNDYLYGGTGNDVLAGGAGDDSLVPGTGSNAIRFGIGAGHDEVAGSFGATNTVVLEQGIVADDIAVTWRSVPYVGDSWSNLSLVVTLRGGTDSITSGVQKDANGSSDHGVDAFQFANGTSWSLQTLAAMANTVTSGNDVLADVAGTDLLTGGDGDDTLYGFEGSNSLHGDGGNDLLLGGDQDDVFVGGTGNDRFVGGRGLSTLRYARGDGNDEIDASEQQQFAIDFANGIAPGDVTLTRTSYAYMTVGVAGGGSIRLNYLGREQVPEVRFADGAMWTSAEITSRILNGTAGADHIVGWSESNDSITGGEGDDVLEGDRGSDLLLGGAGDDTLFAVGDRGSGGGSDRDVLDGGAGNDRLFAGGNAVTYRFAAGFGNDRIANDAFGSRDPTAIDIVSFGEGIAAADVRASQSGYALVLSLASASDTILVNPFFASESTELHTNQLLDRVEFADGTVWTASDLVARLETLITATDDVVRGTAGSDVIDALAGDDSVYAGAGDDVIRGSAGDDTLRGEDGDDLLVGGLGNDALYGGAGNDRYEFQRGDGVDSVGDADGDGSTDTLMLGAGIAASDLEVAFADDPADAWYVIDVNESGDRITVYGIDTVQFDDGTTWTAAQLDQRARTVYGTEADDVVTGTAGNDWLYGLGGNDQLNGSGGDDWLDGGTGTDTLRGGTGNDTYVVDSASDAVMESSGQGSDTVMSSVTLTLGSNIEKLTLTGAAAINGTGNSSANVLTGNSGNNVLNGGSGADTLIGGAGADIYVVDNAGDVATETAAEGNDLVQSSVTYTLSPNVENLTLTGSSAINGTGNTLDNALTGNSAANTLTGGAGNDTLDGGSGSDTMLGGAGNDTYVVNVSTDVVTESANEGMDGVRSTVALTLASNVENLTLTGTSAINGTGNALDNVLTGNSANNTLTGNAGNDTLDGGGGTDTMRGGTGNDTYVVERSADVVTENANEGTDTIRSSITLTLGSNVENLALIGSGAINGTGNTLANMLTGNSANNTLTGAAGADTLDGGLGTDTLIGGTGADRYAFNRGYGVDTVQENDATAGVKDRVEFAAGIVQGDVTFQRSSNNLEALLSGGTDKLIVKDWYLGTQYRVEEFAFNDGTVLTDAQVNNLVSAMAAFAPEASTSMSSTMPLSRSHEVLLASPHVM